MHTTYPTAIANYFVQAAGIPSPWRATKYSVDEVAKMVHIWITRYPPPQVEKKRGWFGKTATAPSAPAAPIAGPERQWRHLNCMDYTCVIHTVDELDARHYDLPWLGQTGLPFTNRMSRQVLMCLMEGMEMGALCAMLNIPFSDLWKFKFGLDTGQVRFEYTPAKKTRPPGFSAAAASPGTASQMAAGLLSNSDNAVPDVGDSVWEQLITGDLNIQIKTLSFQLILTKLRQQVRIQQSEEVKIMKLRELHRYVLRNERSLDHELRQIREQSESGPV